MKRSIIVEIISALLILLFVYTATSKLLEIEKFQATLSKSPLIGPNAVFVSWLLPITELVVAFLLFIPKSKSYGLYASAGLMTVFTVYLGYMLASASKLPCSCGGVLKNMTWTQHLLFNIFFTLLSVWGILLQNRIKSDETAQGSAGHLKAKYSI